MQSSIQNFHSSRRCTYRVYSTVQNPFRDFLQRVFHSIRARLASCFACPIQKDPIYFKERGITGQERRSEYEEASRELIEDTFRTWRSKLKNYDNWPSTSTDAKSIRKEVMEVRGDKSTQRSELRNAFANVDMRQLSFDTFNAVLTGIKHPSSEGDRRFHFNALYSQVEGYIELDDICFAVQQLDRLWHESYKKDDLNHLYSKEAYVSRSLQRLSLCEQIQSGLF